MRIFLTGATGYIGAAVLDALVRAGHEVTALVRDNQKAARVKSRGGHPVIGNLADPESFRTAADAQDGYIHTAFDTTGGGPAIDKAALETIVKAATRPRTATSNGPKKRFIVYTSGVWVLGSVPEPAAEDSPTQPVSLVSWRPDHEQLVLNAAGAGLRTMVVRPGIVYGGGHGIVGDLLKSASNGLVRVIGDGNNHWPLIYDRDLADLYARLAADENASGVYHANDEGDERVNDIVSAIAPYLPVRPDVRHVPIEEARSKMGSYADALALDQIVRSPRARALGWTPTLRSVSGNAARLLEEWRASRT
jgi:nucleoside-diphosphate-sugar epimerase